jgi:hypothetical protein
MSQPRLGSPPVRMDMRESLGLGVFNAGGIGELLEHRHTERLSHGQQLEYGDRPGRQAGQPRSDQLY